MDDWVRLAEGREAEVFLRPDGTVVKLLRDRSHGFRVEREAAALRTLAEHGRPAPKVVDVVTVDDRPGLVMEWLDGTDLLGRLGSRPLLVVRAGRVMGEVHAALHDCVAPDGLPRLHDELRRQIDEAAALPDRLRPAVLDLLEDLPPGDRLCHGDLHLGNIVGTWDAPTLIDWGDATGGDPAADVARTVLLHRFGVLPPGTPRLTRLTAPAGRSVVVARYLATYRRRRPIDRGLLERWMLVRAAARLAEPVADEHAALLGFLEPRLAGT